MTRLDIVFTATFHEDWLKYFKPLHAPTTAGSVRVKPEEHAGAGKGGARRVAFTEP